MPASPNTTPMPEKLRPTIEAEIERLIALLDAMDGDPDLEPSLGFNVLMLTYAGAVDLVDLEGDTADDEPSLGWTELEARFGRYPDVLENDRELDLADDEPNMGATEVRLGAPMSLFGGIMWSLFPALREASEAPAYVSAGFCQIAAWAGPTDVRTDECEPVCEDEGAQCDDEGMARRQRHRRLGRPM